MGSSGSYRGSSLPGEEPRDLPGPERLEEPFDQTAPSLTDADHLALPSHSPARDGADDRIEAGTVASSGQDANLVGHEPYHCVWAAVLELVDNADSKSVGA